MTVIAFDGRILAADCRAESAGRIITVRKIFTLPDGSAMAGWGNLMRILQIMAWYADGALPHLFPLPSNPDQWGSVVIVDRFRRVYVYEDAATPFEVLDPVFAEGSGGSAAKAAMLCGKDAIEAVRVACKIDMGCGNGIDYYDFGADPDVRTLSHEDMAA